MTPTVIVHWDEQGGMTFHVHGAGVRLFTVDERAPDDRVFEIESRVEEKDIAAILRNDPVGHLGDRPIVEQAIRAKLNPGLKLVD
ncbi:hypothetical protein [Inquilinus limosus]|uniref:Uncharacterized protein n=1 Tax=Inquilinus limosus MP06 TaxID=1398085 RepID=A0A0A0DDR5_9PROT|nr:hypothetical protein [Inquilinus limosus]KGM36185.1 hypothetical protein P409_00625 [Inquilinus limosus MP06]